MTEDHGESRPVNWAEKRAHPRYPLLIKGQAFPVGGQEAVAYPVVASNISLGGMVVSGASGDIVNTQDTVRLRFPLLGEPPVELQARVVWRRPGAEPTIAPWSFGLMFFDCDPEQLKRLHEPAKRAFISGLGLASFGLEGE